MPTTMLIDGQNVVVPTAAESAADLQRYYETHPEAAAAADARRGIPTNASPQPKTVPDGKGGAFTIASIGQVFSAVITTVADTLLSKVPPNMRGVFRWQQQFLMTHQRPVPAVARPGVIPTYSVTQGDEYAHRPAIKVYRGNVTGSDGAFVGHFDDWILGSVQESDAEKVEVIETFGAPHLFASGRFIRKYNFAGVLRLAPVNPRAYGGSDDLVLRTSQVDMFRVFYDKYLRATQQAEYGYYTVIEAGDALYRGFVTTYNIHREAATEGFVPFNFSFLGVARSGVHDSDAEARLKVFVGNGKPEGRTGAQQRQDLQNSQGKLTLTLLSQQLTAVAGPVDTNPLGTTNISLKAEGLPLTLAVSVDKPGLEIWYFSGSQANVNGSPARTVDEGGISSITYKITNYGALFDALADAGKVEGKPVGFEIKATNGASVTGTILVTLASKQQSQIATLAVQLNGHAIGPVTLGGTTPLPVQKAADIFDPGSNDLTAVFTATFTRGAGKLPKTAVAGVQLTLEGTAAPRIGDVATAASEDVAKLVTPLTISVTGPTDVVDGQGTYQAVLSPVDPTVADYLNATAIFRQADRFVLKLTATAKEQDGAVVKTAPPFELVVTQVGGATWAPFISTTVEVLDSTPQVPFPVNPLHVVYVLFAGVLTLKDGVQDIPGLVKAIQGWMMNWSYKSGTPGSVQVGGRGIQEDWTAYTQWLGLVNVKATFRYTSSVVFESSTNSIRVTVSAAVDYTKQDDIAASSKGIQMNREPVKVWFQRGSSAVVVPPGWPSP